MQFSSGCSRRLVLTEEEHDGLEPLVLWFSRLCENCVTLQELREEYRSIVCFANDENLLERASDWNAQTVGWTAERCGSLFVAKFFRGISSSLPRPSTFEAGGLRYAVYIAKAAAGMSALVAWSARHADEKRREQ